MKKAVLDKRVDEILQSDFSTFDIVRIPGEDDRRLIDETSSFKGEFAFLDVYLRETSRANGGFPLIIVAKIYRAFHHCMMACLQSAHGRVRGYQGDRVMGVFSGDQMAEEAVTCANYMVGSYIEILEPRIRSLLEEAHFEIGVGVAIGQALVIKAPVAKDRFSGQLLWMGRVPRLVSELSENANAWKGRITICSRSYEKLSQENRYHFDRDGNRSDKWSHGTLESGSHLVDIYRSTWYFSLP